jgi:hypothetical protein
VRSDELLLHLEVVLDKGLDDDLVDAGIDGEAERFDAGAQRTAAAAPSATRAGSLRTIGDEVLAGVASK